MSLESNKKDFETALEEMKCNIEALDACVDNTIMDALKAVITEYEIHYQSDIEELIGHCEAMEDKLAI